MIQKFDGEFRWLSNFHPVSINFEGMVYPSVEHAYVAAKTTDENLRKTIAGIPTAGQVKKFGRTIKIRPDWDKIKLSVMVNLIHEKFKDPTLRTKLIETGDRVLIEGNEWGDIYWGVSKGKGQNNLGKILMAERSML